MSFFKGRQSDYMGIDNPSLEAMVLQCRRTMEPEGRKQLDAARADEHRSGLDALIGDGGSMLDLRAEQPLIGRHRLVEVLDRHAEVVDATRLHRRDASGWA